MRRIKLTLEYEGSQFHGWQIQTKSKQRTVQGVMQKALADLPRALPKLIAAGRTDSGVHALGMVAHYDTEDSISCEKIPKALNARLPLDVRVLNAEEVASNFHAQFDCRYRRYRYHMRLSRDSFARHAFDHQRVLFLYQDYDVQAMQAACQYFIGTHDFAALATQETRPTEREIFLCKLTQEGRELHLHIAANGFLRNMVRAIVGTLLDVGLNKRSPEDIARILASKDRSQAGMNAPPQGLYFIEAGYNPWPNTTP